MIKMNFFKCWFAVIAVAVLLAGCTSSVVLGKAYDNFASHITKRFKSYATFDKQQKAQIEILADGYHSWHRTKQLPIYAKLLRQIVADIDSDGPLDIQTTKGWWSAARNLSAEMRQCNPFNVSAELLAGLSDKQVEQVAERLRTIHDEREERYLAESAEERIERRVAEITKWGKRGGASFNAKQKKLLQKALVSQISLGSQRLQLRRVWLEVFIALLAERKQQSFNSAVTQHIDSMWLLTATNYPEEWSGNEQIWTEFLMHYIDLQTDEQRRVFVDKALKTAVTFEKLAMKEVSPAPVCYQASNG